MRSLSVPLLVTPTIFVIFEGVQADQEFTSVVFPLLASLLFLLEGGPLFERLRCQLNGGDLTRPGALLVLSRTQSLPSPSSPSPSYRRCSEGVA